MTEIIIAENLANVLAYLWLAALYQHEAKSEQRHYS